MTPLAPLYLLAAFAVAGPILFHLWRRTPRGRREFSTLMFLSPSPPRVTSRSRVEHWLLLFIRATVLCLLALAFARPLWRTAISGQDQPKDEELIAILVDTSASLRRAGAWADLQQELGQRLAELPPTATVALFQFDDRWTSIVDFNELKRLPAEERRAVVKSRLATLKPGWYGTNLGNALVRTASALQEAQAEQAIPAGLRILLASDLQSGSRLDALNGFEWPADMRLEPLLVEAQSPTNAGLQLVERNLDAGEDVLRVRISNAANSRKEQFSLAWSGGDSVPLAVYVPPGQSRVVIPPQRPGGVAATSLQLTGDDDDFDNTVHIAPTREETRLVVYCGTAAADDSAGPRFYLEGLFAAAQRYTIQISGWQDALTQSRADRPSLVVLVEPESDAGDFVQAHLAQGGTVLIASGTAAAASAALKQCGISDVEVTEATVKRDAMLGDIDFEHPLFAPFAESQFSDFTGIRFWRHRSLAGFDGETSTGPHGGKVLARFDDKDPAFVEFHQGSGKVWILTGGWHPADSQLARSSKFPPLLFRMLEQATGDSVRAESLPVGSEIVWRIPASDSSSGAVQSPDGEVASVAATAPYTATETPGLYTMQAGGKSDVVAINLAAAESQTAPLPIDQLEGLGVRLGAAESPEELRRMRERERQLQIEELEHVQKLWRWGILMAIVLLLAETWLAGRRTHE